jgi:4-aminobutyrate aminotransferase
MIGIELVKDRETKVRASEERDLVVDRMFAKGVLALGAGRNAIRLCPPLVLSIDQADCAVTAVDEAVGEIAKERGLC